LNKEQILYTKESEDQKNKLDKFVANKAEDWDINNAVCALGVSSLIMSDEHILNRRECWKNPRK
jgi:tubulin-specific chaperone A